MHRQQIIAACGLVVMIFLAWLMSSQRRRFPWRTVFAGVALQVAFALLILGTAAGRLVFAETGRCFAGLLSFVDAGSAFVFGPKYTEIYFAFRVLPTIIFFSSLMSILYHCGVMQAVVRVLGRIMQTTLGTSGAESLAAAANIFVGQTEAPLVVLPYLRGMTRSELMAVMVGGFSTIAGGVMAAYVGMGVSAGHLLTASVISAPAGLVIAKVMQPETESPETLGRVTHSPPRQTTSVMEAATMGASQGLQLALNVAAMIIAFLSLIALVDFLLAQGSVRLQEMLQVQSPVAWKLSTVFGIAFAPVAWLMGIEWRECGACGQLLGLKIVLNEFLAYEMMADWKRSASEVSPLSVRSEAIMTYALCGFSNFASVGVQVGGIGGLVPERRADVARLGLRAMLGGTLACCMTACIAGIIIGDGRTP